MVRTGFRGRVSAMKEYRFYGWETADIKDANGLTPRDYYDILSGIWCADTCAPRMRDRWSVHFFVLVQGSNTHLNPQKSKKQYHGIPGMDVKGRAGL